MLHQKGHAQVFTTGTGIQRLSHSFSERSKTQFIKLKEREITTLPGYLTFGARHYPSPPNQGGNSAPHIPLTLPANPSAMSSGTGIQHFSVFLNKRRQNKKPYSPPRGILHVPLLFLTECSSILGPPSWESQPSSIYINFVKRSDGRG